MGGVAKGSWMLEETSMGEEEEQGEGMNLGAMEEVKMGLPPD